METKLSQFRKQYPQYDNRPDDELLKALHSKHYADRDYDDFVSRMTTPLPGMDETETVNPETGQPWTRDEIEATKITPSPDYESTTTTNMNPEPAYQGFEEQQPEERVTAADYGVTMQAGAAKVASNRLNEMEAERRRTINEIVEARIKKEGEENRAKIEGEVTARVNRYGTGSFYDAFIRPFFSKDDKTPGERISDWADAKLRTRSDVAQRKGQIPFVASDAKWYAPSTWFDGETVFSDPEAFFLKVAENAPQIGISYGGALVGGKGGALRAVRNLGDKARSNPALVREVVQQASERGGKVAGFATEYVLIRDSVANETRDRILQLPDEKFYDYPGFDDMVEDVGMARAKQMIADETARTAGMVAAPMSALLGAPASGLIGRIGGGTATTTGNVLSRMVKTGGKAALMEAPTEGTQEVIEQIAGNIGVSAVDPEQAWTEGSLNAFFGGAALGGAFGGATGVLGGLAPETGQTRDTRDLMADEKTRTYLESARDREKLQSKMSNTDELMKMSNHERLQSWEELERLEEKEAKLMLKAEPGLRRNIMRQSADPEVQKRSLRLLDTLTAKSRTTLKQIEMMRRERQTEDELSQQVERQEKARQEINRRVEQDMTALQEYEEMAAAIEEVQQGGVVSDKMYDSLAERGYGRWTDKQKSEFVITRKGQEALPEMRRQANQLSENLETGYTGPERRKDLARRERVARMTPEQREEALHRDPNTQLKNRRAYQTDEETEPSDFVAVIDADSLKWVNDNMGHEKGNYLLRKVARALRSQAAERAYHLSGDEFVVTADSQEELEALMTRAEERLSALRPISDGEVEVQPGISWGVGTNLEEADKAMSASKVKRETEGKRAARGEPPPTMRAAQLQEGDIINEIDDPEAKAKAIEARRHGEHVGTEEDAMDDGNLLLALGLRPRKKRKEAKLTPVSAGAELLQNIIKWESPESNDQRYWGIRKIFEPFLTIPAKGKQPARTVGSVRFQLVEITGMVGDKVIATATNPRDGETERGGQPSGTVGVGREYDPNEFLYIAPYEAASQMASTIAGIEEDSLNLYQRRKMLGQMRKLIWYGTESAQKYEMLTGLRNKLAEGAGRAVELQGKIDDAISERPRRHESMSPLVLSMADFAGGRFRRATKNEMRRARRVVYSMVEGFSNIPPEFIKVVNTVEDLPRHMQHQLLAMGANMRVVKGMFDEQNPRNGIYIIVGNMKPRKNQSGWVFERDVAEVLMHETIGHYGLRGLLGSEVALGNTMDAIAAAFPDLVNRKSLQYTGRPYKKLFKSEQRVMAEELVADIAGKILSDRITLDKQQKSAWRRLMETIRQWLIDRGLGRFARGPLAFKDKDILDLIQRSQDFVRHQKNWAFERDTGESLSPYVFMQDSEVYISRLQAAFSAKRLMNKAERKQAGGLPAGSMTPVLRDNMTRQQWIKALKDLANQGMFSSEEVEWAGLNEWLEGGRTGEFTFSNLMDAGMSSSDVLTWLKSIAPQHAVIREKLKRMEPHIAIMQEPAARPHEQMRADMELMAELTQPIPATVGIPKQAVVDYVRKNQLVIRPRAPKGYQFNEQAVHQWVKSENPGLQNYEVQEKAAKLIADWRENGPPFDDPRFEALGGFGLQQGSLNIRLRRHQPDGSYVNVITDFKMDREAKTITMKFNRDAMEGAQWPQGQPVMDFEGDMEYYDAELEATKSMPLPTSAWVKKVTEDTIVVSPMVEDDWWDSPRVQGLMASEDVRPDNWTNITIPYMAYTNAKWGGHVSWGMVPETYREYLLRVEHRDKNWYSRREPEPYHWTGMRYGSNDIVHLRTGMVYDANPRPENRPAARGLAYFLNEIQSDWFQYLGKRISQQQKDAAESEKVTMMRIIRDMVKQMHTATNDVYVKAIDSILTDDIIEMAQRAENEEGVERGWRVLRDQLSVKMDAMQNGLRQGLENMRPGEKIFEVSGSLRDFLSSYVPGPDIRSMDLLHIEALRRYVEKDLIENLNRARNAIGGMSESEIREITREPTFSDEFEKAGRKSIPVIGPKLVQRAKERFLSESSVFYDIDEMRMLRLPLLNKAWEQLIRQSIGNDAASELRKAFDNIETRADTAVKVVPTDDFEAAFGPKIGQTILEFFLPQLEVDFPNLIKLEPLLTGNVTGQILSFNADPKKTEEISNRIKQIVPFVTDEIRQAVERQFNEETMSRDEALEHNRKLGAQGTLFEQPAPPVPATTAQQVWAPLPNTFDSIAYYSTQGEEDHNEYGVEDWEDFENNIDWGYEISEYWDNYDWESAQHNGEDLDESHSVYQSIEEIQGYQAAEQWLQQARENYQSENEDEANEYVRESMRERFDGSEGPVAHVMQFDAHDEDGDAVEIRVVIRRTSEGESFDLVVDRDGDQDWEALDNDWSDTQLANRAGDLVLRWLQDNDLTPPQSHFHMVDPSRDPETVPQEVREDKPVPVPQVTIKDPSKVDWKLMAEELEKNLMIVTGDPVTMEKSVERYTEAWKTRRKSVSQMEEPPINEKKMYEAAVQFLISEAIRSGTRRIMWHGGESSTERGGVPGNWKLFDAINWSPMSYIDVTGKRNKAYRIATTGGEYGERHVLYVRQSDLPMVVGHDVARYIRDQEAGNKPTNLISPKGQKVPPYTDRREPSYDDIIVRETAMGNFIAYHQNRPEEVMATATSREDLRAKIDEMLEEAKRLGRWPWASDTSGETDMTPEGEHVVPDMYVVGKQHIGGRIGIMIGDTFSPSGDYAPTQTDRPRMFGSRFAYGPKLESNWNKFLKKFGVQIQDFERIIPGATEYGSLSMENEMFRQSGEPGADMLEAEYGKMGVVDMGNGGPYVVESEKRGMLGDQMYRTYEEAKAKLDELRRSLPGIYGLRDPKTIMTRGFDITDEMVEAANKGWPLLAYSPYDDPVIQAAAKRIGARKTPLRERYDNMMYRWKDKFNQGMFDRFHGIKSAMRRVGLGNMSAENNPYVQARLTTSLDSVMRAVMEYGHPVWKEGIVQTEGRGLLDILQPVAKQLDLWGMYMAGVRAKRLMEEGREKNFTPEMIEKMVNLGEQFPVFKDVARDYAAFNKQVLDFAEEAGVINPETRPLWENADYVPFYRVQDDRLVGPLGRGKGIANVRQPIKRLKGGEDPIGDITHNILMNTTQLIDSAMKNHAAKMAVDALDGTGLIQKMPWAFSSQLVPMKQVEKLLVQHGMDPATIPDEAKKGFQSLMAMQPPKGDGVISIMRDGKKEFYYTDDTLLYEAMTAINQKQWGLWMRMLRKPKRLLTTAVTLDPGFMIRNYIRDLLSAFVIGRNPYVPFTRSAQGFKEALMKDESYRTMLSAGAAFENGYINAYDPTATQRQIRSRMKTRGIDASTVLNTPLKLFEAWKAIGSASENANRIAQYHAALAAGKSKAQAVYESKDLMDFSMGGSWAPIQILIQTVPFMGARLQGLHRLGRGAAEQPLAFMMKGAIVGMAGLALWFQYKDDERYKELEEWDKDVYFHFWIGDQHYRLPKPFEVGAIFNTIPERAFEFMYNEENDAGKLLLKRFGFMLGETFNFNPIPQAFMPAVESIFNYSFFTGGPITSPWEEKRMGPEQYRYYNSPSMIELARHLPDWIDKFSDPPGKLRSPRHLQHLFSGYFGTLGKYFLMATDAVTRNAMSYPAPPTRSIADMPVIGSFARGSQPRRTKYEEEFYALLTKTFQVKNSLSFLNKIELDERMDLLEEKYEPYVNIAKELENYRQEISKLNNEVMQIYIDPNLTPSQKREQIDAIQLEKNAVFKDAYGLRPGGKENIIETASPENLKFLIEKFGMDELQGEMQKAGNNATASLIEDVVNLSDKQAGTLQ